MSLITLGLAGAIGHDPAAALFVDGELVAAVEEERLVRRKHAKGMQPYHAARYCLQQAGVAPHQVNIVATSYAPISLFSPARWHYARRHWYAPDRAFDAVFMGNRRYRRHLRELRGLLDQLHIPWRGIRYVPVQHQLAHASSAYHLSGWQERTAIFTIDSRGEYATMLLAVGEKGRIRKVREFYDPDSLSGMYAAMTDYLGFDMLDGEYRVMGMSPFGDADKYDLSPLVAFNGRDFRINNQLISTVGLRRFRGRSRGHFFSPKLVEMLGPRREGNLVDDPYVHYAATIQRMYEDIAAGLLTHYLYPALKDSGRLAFAGTGAMNIKLVERLQQLPAVQQVAVHPGCGDSGTAIGAASYALSLAGVTVKPLRHVFLGPRFTKMQCISACKAHREKPQWEELENAPRCAAELLAAGHPVAWFQGRMEFGPRALGNRSILAHPALPDSNERLNRQVKFRERWRPFCPSVLDSFADEFLDAGGLRPRFMTQSLPVRPQWRETYASVVYCDGTTRPQVVSHECNPRLHQLLKFFQELTGHALVINTALNRPGEALVCTPEDAVEMFLGSDLNYLVMEDILVTRRPESEKW